MDQPLILLADDEAPITCVVGQRLEAAGYALMVARDGLEAFELATARPPRAVITDLQMPRMSGLELATRLRETPATTDIPIILLTARGYILTPEQMARTNIRHLISKPFSAKDVLKRLTELLGGTSQGVAA